MAYIRKMKNKEGRIYVYLVEGYRENGKVKSRILKKYGYLDELEAQEPGIFEKLKKEAKEGKLVDKKILDVSFPLDVPIYAPDKSYGWKILDDIFNALELEKFFKSYQRSRLKTDISKVTKLLVFQRILNPDSKFATIFSQTDLFGDWNIPINSVYRYLEELNTLKEDVQNYLHKKICKLRNRTASLVFYDVTNYYFETDTLDEIKMDESGKLLTEGLRQRGPSKEHRPKPIIQLGLFMDMDGIPISYKLFRGNQTDPITYLPAVKEVKRQFGIERMIVVADKAMNSKTNVSKMFEQGDGWLFSQKHRGKRGAPKDIQDKILEVDGWQFNEEMTFAKKSYIRERKLGNKKEGPTVKEKILITWSKKYADREKIRRNGALEYASKLTNAELFRQTSKKGGKKYLDVTYCDLETGEILPYSPIISIDQEQVDFDAQFDGINVLVTSEIDMSDERILASYKELSKIEDCFRITKTDLESRPVYVRKETRIQGHFLTCFLALMHLRLLQNRINWQLSPEKLILAMNSAKATKIKDGYYRLQENEEMKELNKLLGIEWKKGIVKLEELNYYGKDSYTTRRIDKKEV